MTECKPLVVGAINVLLNENNTWLTASGASTCAGEGIRLAVGAALAQTSFGVSAAGAVASAAQGRAVQVDSIKFLELKGRSVSAIETKT
jgi:hypothetical protein